MTHVILLATVAAVMVVTMALPGTAFARSCFDELAKLPGPGPGNTLVSPLATSLAQTQTSPVAAQLVPVLQKAKQACENP